MAADGLDAEDVFRAIRAGVVEEAEWEGGEWRHRVRTPRVVVSVTFEAETVVVVVTAWES